MPHKKNHNPFDLSNMFPTNEKGFGFNIESSFVQGSSARQKSESKKRKKFVDARFRAVQSGSAEPLSPSEEIYSQFGKDVYGRRKL